MRRHHRTGTNFTQSRCNKKLYRSAQHGMSSGQDYTVRAWKVARLESGPAALPKPTLPQGDDSAYDLDPPYVGS